MNIDFTLTLSILKYWMRLTFLEASLENSPAPWYIIRFGGISIDWKEESSLALDYNLIYFHSSPHLLQIDFLFINLLTKFR